MNGEADLAADVPVKIWLLAVEDTSAVKFKVPNCGAACRNSCPEGAIEVGTEAKMGGK